MTTGPLLVAHTHANWVLSDIKLAVEGATGDEPVVILQRLGTPDEPIVTHDLGGARPHGRGRPPHVRLRPAPRRTRRRRYVRFHQLARTLREQCPWDQRADPRSR